VVAYIYLSLPMEGYFSTNLESVWKDVDFVFWYDKEILESVGSRIQI
jgi:hypothetical protein